MKELWEALYLQANEIEDLLGHAKQNAAHPWIYALITMAAHTGARQNCPGFARFVVLPHADFPRSVVRYHCVASCSQNPVFLANLRACGGSAVAANRQTLISSRIAFLRAAVPHFVAPLHIDVPAPQGSA